MARQHARSLLRLPDDVCSAHTHAGPDVIGLWTPAERTLDAVYVARIRSQAVGSDGLPAARIACVPGEIYPELVLGGILEPQDPGADFQGAPAERPLGPMLGARHRLIVGLCNDELGYIIPMSEWDEKAPFAYGRDEPQYGEINSAGPRVAPLVLRVFEDLLNRP